MLLKYFPLILALFSLIKSTSLPNVLLNQQFQGKYTQKQNIKLFQYLDVQQGRIQMTFIKNFRSTETDREVNEAIIEFFNPKYKDDKTVKIKVNLNEFKLNGAMGWFEDNIQINITKYKKDRQNGKFLCRSSYKILIKNNQKSQDPHNIYVHFQLKSNESKQCTFNINGQLSFRDDKIPSIFYSSFISGVSLIQLAFTYRMIKNHNNGIIATQKISLTTIVMCTIQDFFLAMTHVYFVVLKQTYLYFILPIFLLVVQSIFFDMRLIFAVWRAVNMQQDLSTSELRKRLTMFYVKFYLALFAYVALMYFFYYEMWIMFLQPFLLYLPQIVKNIRNGNRPYFYTSYIIGLLGMKIVLPLYNRGCPQNIYFMTPSSAFCIMWVICFLLQITILFLQQKFGPRFFIPNKCIPGYFNYNFLYVPSNNINEDIPDCSICLMQITQKSQQQSNGVINTSINTSLVTKPQPIQIMRTPCLHLFHPECLKQWIDVKLECPSCKTQLPPIIS